jgi:hypothetical protein
MKHVVIGWIADVTVHLGCSVNDHQYFWSWDSDCSQVNARS